MNYYYINTDTEALTDSPHDEWISQGYAFTSGEGPADYKKYGVEVLGILAPSDICFMYASGYGIMAAGTVRECWDGCGYESETRKIYHSTSYTEYRIPVDWNPVVNNPITIQEIREIFGWQSPSWGWRRTLGDIDRGKGEHLLAEVMRRYRVGGVR